MKMSFVLPFVLILIVQQTKGWVTNIVIPAVEDQSCPNGTVIACSTTIVQNGTILRYERGNLTADSSAVPGKDCPWKIRAPRGTTILLETSCYHHIHAGNQSEYEVCFTQEPVSPSTFKKSSSCGAKGYIKNSTAPTNQIDFFVSYKNGKRYALGFTVKFTFLGTPLPAITTTAKTTSTTSDALRTQGNFVFMVLFLLGIIYAIV